MIKITYLPYKIVVEKPRVELLACGKCLPRIQTMTDHLLRFQSVVILCGRDVIFIVSNTRVQLYLFHCGNDAASWHDGDFWVASFDHRCTHWHTQKNVISFGKRSKEHQKGNASHRALTWKGRNGTRLRQNMTKEQSCRECTWWLWHACRPAEQFRSCKADASVQPRCLLSCVAYYSCC